MRISYEYSISNIAILKFERGKFDYRTEIAYSYWDNFKFSKMNKKTANTYRSLGVGVSISSTIIFALE